MRHYNVLSPHRRQNMTNPQEPELLPCPLCLHEAASFKTGGDRGIFCLNCGLRLNPGLPFDEIKKRWNTRATPPKSCTCKPVTYTDGTMSREIDVCENCRDTPLDGAAAGLLENSDGKVPDVAASTSGVMSAEALRDELCGILQMTLTPLGDEWFVDAIKQRDAAIRNAALEESANLIETIDLPYNGQDYYGCEYAEAIRKIKTNHGRINK